MENGELIELLRRGVVAIERLADRFDPEEESRERIPAILSSATYSREERERRELRERLKGKANHPERSSFVSTGTDL